MQLSLQTSVIVLLCCLLEGLYGLRMLKVSIPAYKLRGESAFLECQYELERRKSSVLQEGYQDTHEANKGDVNYSDIDSQEEELPVHTHNYGYPYTTNRQQHYQRQQSEHYKRFRNSKRSTHYQNQQQQQQQQQQHYKHYQYPEHQHQHQQHDEWPYQTPPSPYGHSIYRGRSSASVSAAAAAAAAVPASSSLSSSSAYSVNFGTHAGTRTHLIDVENARSEEHGDSFIDSTEDSQQQFEEQDGLEDEENEELYAIKWYKDNEEFYRYVPKANPPKTSYRVDGVRVIEEHSDSSRVLLRGLTINATGLYRCEISAEAPNFSSVVGEGQLDVVYLPRDGPHIKGQQFQYQIGETLNLNCTSGKSHPASYLQWYINDKPITDRSLLIAYNNTVHRHGLITATLGLNLIVEPHHFDNGAMRVKCVASISPILWKGGKESILQRRPGLIDNREAMLLVHGASSSIHFKNFQLICLLIIAFLIKITKL